LNRIRNNLYLFGVPAAFIVGAGLFYPILRLFIEGVGEALAYPLFTDPLFRRALVFTYGQALVSAILSGAVGIAGALIYSEQRFLGRELLWRWSLVCFSMPTLLVVLAWVAFWGRRGWIASLWGPSFPSLYGWTAILTVHVFFNFPLYLRGVGIALSQMDRAAEMSALSLGAGRLRCFLRITLPKIRPAIASAFFLSFLYCSFSFLPVMLLGGGPAYTTLEMVIYQATKMDLNLALASRCALIQLGVSALIYVFFLRETPATSTPRESAFVPLYFPRTGAGAVRAIYLSLLLFLAAGPIFALGAGGLSGIGSLVRGGELVSASLTSLILSSIVSITTLLIAAGLALGERHAPSPLAQKVFGAFASLPLGVSSVLLGLAWILTYAVLFQQSGSWVGVVLTQSLVAVPLVYRPLRDGLFQISDSSLVSAASLGANSWQRFWWIELPQMRKALLLSMLLGFAISLGEVAALLMLLPEGATPLPLLVYRLMGRYQFAEAHAAGAVLLLILLVVFAVIGKLENESRT